MSCRSRRTRAVALFGVVAVLLAACANGPVVGDDREPPSITAKGIGRVRGVPDTVVVTLGVETESPQAVDALNANNDRTRQVIDLLKGAGVAEEDIQTSQFSISPRFDNEGRRITGYLVSNLLTARVREGRDPGALIDAAARAAGDDIRVQSIGFEIDDDSELLAEARREAVEEARRQAEQLANAAGVDLGDVRSITESTTAPPPIPFALQRTDEAAGGVPIESGSQELTLEVQIVYEISD